MESKRVLGRGLAALIPNLDLKEKRDLGMYFLCPIEEIKPNPNQPRKNFDEQRLQELSLSIKERGIIEPLIVKKLEKGYELIAGERRLRAAKLANLAKVPVLIKDFDKQNSTIISLIENLQREDLNPIDEANGYLNLIKNHNLSHDDIAKNVSKDRSTITNMLRLLKLPLNIQELIKSGKISSGHARALINLPTEELQNKLASEITAKNLSVRTVETITKKNIIKTEGVITDNIELGILVERLKRSLKTKIEIKHAGNQGKIIIDYYSNSELERLVEILAKG